MHQGTHDVGGLVVTTELAPAARGAKAGKLLHSDSKQGLTTTFTWTDSEHGMLQGAAQ